MSALPNDKFYGCFRTLRTPSSQGTVYFFLLLLQGVQIYNQKLNYLNFENVLEWFVYILSILFVAPVSQVSYQYSNGAGSIMVREVNIDKM